MPLVKTALKWLGGLLAAAMALVAAFLLLAWIGSSIPRNGQWREPAAGVDIMVETNGIHTAIVVPLVTPQKDWREDFPARDLLAPSRPYSHVSISWGSREVFLNTPSWSDLTVATALNALWDSGALLHVAHYVRPMPSPYHRELTITHAQYGRLVALVEQAMLPVAERERFSGYGDNDVFYLAAGSYHLGRTCNQWTSDVLAGAGIRTGLWTPFAGGVMKWVPPPPADSARQGAFE